MVTKTEQELVLASLILCIAAVISFIIYRCCFHETSENNREYEESWDSIVTPESLPPTLHIDLHGMTKQEALQKVKQVLSTKPKKSTVRFVTGRGVHSLNGIPVIKNAVIDFLKRNGYKYNIDSAGGCIYVY